MNSVVRAETIRYFLNNEQDLSIDIDLKGNTLDSISINDNKIPYIINQDSLTLSNDDLKNLLTSTVNGRQLCIN